MMAKIKTKVKAKKNAGKVKSSLKKKHKIEKETKAETPSKRVRFVDDPDDEQNWTDGDNDSASDVSFDFGNGDEDMGLPFNDPIMDEDDEELAEEEKEFLARTRRGESFPIVTDKMDGVSDEEDDQEEDQEADKKHKKSLKKLKEKDPQFYEFLEGHEKELLDFEAEDDDSGEEDEESGPKVKVTDELLLQWSEKLQADKVDKETIRAVVEVFRVCVKQAAGDDVDSRYKVDGSQMFNSVVRVCFVDLMPAFHKFLKLPPPTSAAAEGKSINPSNCNNWKKLAGPIKTYLTYIINVLDVVSEPQVLAKVLRHCLYLIPFVGCFPALSKKFLIKVAQFWSQGDEKVRVLSFLCIVRLMRDQPPNMLNHILKKLYISYAKNCKLTSRETWPMINFMKQSLVELYSLDQGVAYQQAFVFIRQCAIHLRNAMTGKTKDGYKAVYNWHFVHSLLLWQRLLCCLHPSEVLKPLIYPLVQVIVGAIK